MVRGNNLRFHNDSRLIRQALAEVLRNLNLGERGLNLGCGTTRLHHQIVNVDIIKTPSADCVADGQNLPFPDETFSLVITQETIEHVRDPLRMLNEINRVLCASGVLYCQAPFIIGYHPGPTDFWRFTREGIQELAKRAGFYSLQVGTAVGPATGLYRIVVEFMAIIAARFVPSLYIPVKAIFALFLYPLKWLDSFSSYSPQADRVAGGYFIIARKEKKQRPVGLPEHAACGIQRP